MSDPKASTEQRPLNVALCIDQNAIDRFRRVIQHLLVGLVDQAVSLRVVSSDSRVQRFSLGPARATIHQPPAWPWTRQRLGQLIDAVSGQPPMVVHAVARDTFRVAAALAEAFDADPVVQVTSLADCEALANWQGPPIARYIAMTQSLAIALTDQLSISKDRVVFIRPGALAGREIMCFPQPERTATLLSVATFDDFATMEPLIDAVTQLVKNGHSFMLFILGEGRQESKVRRIIRDRNLTANVALAHAEGTTAQAIDSADIFVRPSVDKAFYDDSLHAMATGTVVVSCPNPLYDHLRDGETAVVCQQASASSLVEGIEKLLNDHDAARDLAARGMEYVRKHHAMSAMAEQTANLYRTLALARATFRIKE